MRDLRIILFMFAVRRRKGIRVNHHRHSHLRRVPFALKVRQIFEKYCLRCDGTFHSHAHKHTYGHIHTSIGTEIGEKDTYLKCNPNTSITMQSCKCDRANFKTDAVLWENSVLYVIAHIASCAVCTSSAICEWKRH